MRLGEILKLRTILQPALGLFIPTGKSSYLARDTRENIPEKQKKFSKIKVGRSKIFNEQALLAASESDEPIFIVEGELDALSIIEVGGNAVALGSTANKRIFIRPVLK